MTDPLEISADAEREIFLAALELDSPEERAVFLDRACANNPTMRLAVETLLQHHREDAFMQPPGLNAAPRPSLEKPGDRIGRYRLLQQIGEGGCGVVYMAEQEQPVRRRVALKVIKLGMDTKSVIARFEAERQALALMDHPNIAKVLDAGATETGRPYFVMELVRGIKITDYCDQNSLATSERLEIFAQVCRAIQHAHQKGVIHRDIKPSNILVTMNDGVPVPKVIDFGIAKATEGRLTDKTLFTAFEQFIGTPAYMSPEQAEMSARDIDTRSDIYSLGVLLYELLTGRTPFDADLLRAGLDEIRQTIREKEPARPSTRLSTMLAEELTTTARCRRTEPLKLIHLVRGDLDWIVMKALEKDRTRRYETANGLAADIQRHVANETVLARPPSSAYRLQKAWQRNKTAFAAAALIAAVLVAATGISAWQAILAKKRLGESEAISKFLTEVFQSPDPARDGRTITVAETLGAAAKKLETDLASQPERRATLLATLAKTYHKLGLDREAVPLQEKVRADCLAAYGLENAQTLQAMHNLALFYAGTGRAAEALELGEKVLALRRKVLGPEHPDTLWSMNNLALSYRDAGRTREALQLREETLALRRKVSGPENPDTLWAMNTLALSYDDAGRWSESLKLREEAAAGYRKVKGPEHPDTLVALRLLSYAYDEVGRREEALKLQLQLVPASRKVLGPEHPDTLWVMHDLGISYDEAERWDEAIRVQEETLALRRKVLGPEHFNTLWTMHTLATSYDGAGRRAEALKLREQVLELRQKNSGPENVATLAAMEKLAVSYDEAGRRQEALEMREKVLALDRKVYGPEQLELFDGMQNLAISYEEAGRRDEALKLREEVLARSRKVLAGENPDSVRAKNELAQSYGSAGRVNEALALLTDACAARPRDATALLALAAWQVWFGPTAEFEGIHLAALRQMEDTDQALTADRAAKAGCLQPSTNTVLLAKALALGWRSVELGKTNTMLPVFQLGLGMAQYRNGQYADAEKSLDAAQKGIGSFPEMAGTARLYRAMSLFRQNRLEEARGLFHEVEAQMPPLPADERKPQADGRRVDENLLIWWLAYKEARTLVQTASLSFSK